MSKKRKTEYALGRFICADDLYAAIEEKGLNLKHHYEDLNIYSLIGEPLLVLLYHNKLCVYYKNMRVFEVSLADWQKMAKVINFHVE
jgi:hypothetical protein